MFVPWFTKPDTEKKILQVVNLSPSEDLVERIVKIHPMRQIVWATIIQATVFGFMIGAFALINLFLKSVDKWV